MRRFNLTQLAAAFAAALAVTMTALPAAHGELVYEDSPTGQAQANANAPAQPADPNGARVADRADLRQALAASQREQVALQAQQASAPAAAVTTAPLPAQTAQAPATVVAGVAIPPPPAQAPATVGAADDANTDVSAMSQAELIRRERMREELKNEDTLQARLEELRLRDERKRTDEILGASPTDAQQPGAPVAAASPAPVLQQQAIQAPVTEHPGQPAAQPSVLPAPVQLAGISSADAAAANQSSMTANVDMDKDQQKKTVFSITPRAGIGGMASQGDYNINPQFATGIGIEAAANDYLSFDLGYTYAQYGVAMASGNPFMMSYGESGNYNTLTMNQNVFDGGLTLHLLDRDATFRPFIGGGVGYARTYINYAQGAMPYMGGYGATNWNVNQYLGYLSAGGDVRITRNISVNLMFRYYAVLASSQNGQLNNYAFLNSPYSGSQQYVAGTMAMQGFYNILAGATFSF